MHCRSQVMDDMITIVPAGTIITCVDTIDRTCKMIFRIIFVNKCMLRPITEHHNKTGYNKRNDKDPQRCFEVYKTHDNTESKK